MTEQTQVDSESILQACKSESSKHVSITYEQIGGVDADFFEIYSIVVN